MKKEKESLGHLSEYDNFLHMRTGTSLDQIMFNPDDKISVAMFAEDIRRYVESGASVEDLTYYTHASLKATLTHFQIPGRSKLTYKKDMAEKLISVYGKDKKVAKKVSKRESFEKEIKRLMDIRFR